MAEPQESPIRVAWLGLSINPDFHTAIKKDLGFELGTYSSPSDLPDKDLVDAVVKEFCLMDPVLGEIQQLKRGGYQVVAIVSCGQHGDAQIGGAEEIVNTYSSPEVLLKTIKGLNGNGPQYG